VCRKHGITAAQLRSDCRDMELVHARQEAMYRLRTEKNLSLSAIGRELGKRDHTTVIHGIKQHKKRI
jgi:chromosomal replication initiator protein